MSPINTYKQRYQHFEQQAQRLRRQVNLISFARLFSFLGGVGLMVYLLQSATLLVNTIIFFILITLFFLIVKTHHRLRKKRDSWQHLATVNQQEIAALQYNFSGQPTGQEFADITHPYTSDLDVFGERSLFQFLNRTSTHLGKQTLAQWLQQPANKATILARQEAVKDLQQKIDFRQLIQSQGLNIAENEAAVQGLLHWINRPYFITKSNFLKISIYASPLLLIFLLGLVGLGYLSIICLLPSYLFHLALLKFANKEVIQTMKQTTEKLDIIETYAAILHSIEQEKFSSAKLQSLQQLLHNNTTGSAAKQLEKLASLGANLNARSNFLAFILLNTGFLWELLFLFRLEYWRKQVGSELKQWLAVIAEMEALSSLGTLYYNYPNWVMPQLSADYFQLEGTAMGHCLLSPDKRVANDVSIEKKGKILLITGSNMAGKSTFLRTVGLNMVLAFAGAPVCAKQLNTSIVTIFTSMRTHDSLQDNESAFYAELKRLKAVIDTVIDGTQPIFFLLDEILKGTNSDDRHQGSVALIKQLVRHQSAGIIATHDLALCDMEEHFPDAIENACFEVAINDNGMVFDYKIKKGVCQSRNATKLMRQMGIEL